MGPIGVEGTFTKAAESTLSALKENSNGLLTILSAIVSDPLYKWSIGSKKRNRHSVVDYQDDEGNKPDQCNDNLVTFSENSCDDNRNEVAAHAISRIHEKLLGYEDGTLGERQSVESQVQLLLNAAQDPENLCVMFAGWVPFQ
jgi:phosphatidylinositol kinase/protein kinase (PI-3  family)